MMDNRMCSCGMPRIPIEGFPPVFSRQWQVEHRARHLAAFPDVDALTRSNLDEAVARAA